jgi:hypothetical protein
MESELETQAKHNAAPRTDAKAEQHVTAATKPPAAPPLPNRNRTETDRGATGLSDPPSPDIPHNSKSASRSGGGGPSSAQQPTPSGGNPYQDRVDYLNSLLQPGHVVYRAPSPMRVGDWQRVVVRIAGIVPPAGFSEDLPGAGSLQHRDLKIGPDLTVVLSSPEFTVRRAGGDADNGERSLPSGGSAEWQWDVQPQRGGAKKLHLEVFVRVTDDAKSMLVKTFDQDVIVEGNIVHAVGGWLALNWAATGLTVPVVFGGLWAWLRSRKGADERQETRRQFSPAGGPVDRSASAMAPRIPMQRDRMAHRSPRGAEAAKGRNQAMSR